MKRIISLILILTMSIVSFCGCSDQNDTYDDDESKVSSEEHKDETSSKEESASTGFKLSTWEYGEKVEEFYPKIEGFITVTDDGETFMSTDTGSGSSYNKVFMVTDTTVLYSETIKGKQYLISYSPDNSVIVRDNTGTVGLESLLKVALACVSNYSDVPTADELAERFYYESKLSNGVSSYYKTAGNIKYEIMAGDEFTIVMLRFSF